MHIPVVPGGFNEPEALKITVLSLVVPKKRMRQSAENEVLVQAAAAGIGAVEEPADGVVSARLIGALTDAPFQVVDARADVGAVA